MLALAIVRLHPRGPDERREDHIIAEARRRRYRRLSLETGSGPAFDPAFNLYRKYCFVEGEAFGDYRKSHYNRFMHLDLAP